MHKQTITNVKKYVQQKMAREATGHDWFHVERVYKTATFIAKHERDCNLFIIQAAALLHDIGDWKLNKSEKTEEQIIVEALTELRIPSEQANAIKTIILNMSYSKSISGRKKLSKEGQIVQDADRLEALGAIGIARAFAYGGKTNREIYNPARKPQEFITTEEYRSSTGHTINHFYEKLFKIRKQLNTRTGKTLALKREKFMKDFLKEFFAEWHGKI